MGVRMKQHFLSVERRTEMAHTWLDSALKPSTVPVCNDDPRPWTVVHPDNANIDSDRFERCTPVSQSCGRRPATVILKQVTCINENAERDSLR